MPKEWLITSKGPALSEQSESKGFSLIEVLLAGSLLSLLVTAFVGVIIYGRESTMLAGQRSRATFLAEEGLEGTRAIRNANYSNLINGDHGLAVSGGVWTFSGTLDSSGIFTRKVTISDLGTNRKQAVSTVSWTQNLQRSGSVILTTELSNWNKMIGNWAIPSQQSSIDLPGAQNGDKVQVQGNYAYMVRHGGTPEFVIVDISNPASPAIVGTLVLNGSPNNLFVSGNYAYVVGNYSSQELQIVNISNPSSPSLVGSYDAPGTSDMVGVYAVGTTIYLGRVASTQAEFYIINASVPAAPTLLGLLELGASNDSNEIYVSGNYAFVASADNSQELKVINVSNPATPTLVGGLDLSGTQDGSSITGFGNTVIVGRLGSGGVATIDITTPTAPTLLSTFSVGGAVRDLFLGVDNGYLFIASDVNTKEFQVVDISTLSAPTLVGSLNTSADLNGVAYYDSQDRAVIVSDYNAGEFAILKPQ